MANSLYRDRLTIESVRRYWDAQPCNLRHSALPIGTPEYFAEVSARKAFVEPHISAFARYGEWRGMNVLEVGCGIGTDTERFAAAGANVVALDLSPSSVALTRLRLEQAGLQACVIEANIEEQTRLFASLRGSFDLVYAFGVLHHTPLPDLALENMVYLLKPGGTIKVMVYHARSWKALLIRLGLAQSEAQSGCPIARTYTKAQGRALLERHGIVVESLCVEHIFPWRIADYQQYRYVKALPWRMMPARVFHRLEHIIGWHLCITGRKGYDDDHG